LFSSCYSEKGPNEFYSLPCRHQHCLTCWQVYLESNIVQGGCGQSISCPSRCNQVIDDEQILKLLSTNENVRQRYQRLLVDTFVQTNRLTQWCPGNGCITIVKMKTYTPNCAQMIECDMCKMIFCFQCVEQWHEPIQCSVLLKWEQKNHDESMTGKWILASISLFRFLAIMTHTFKPFFRH
jgi:ariadne-1